MIVADANVIAYYFIPGPQTEKTTRLRSREPEWVAPLLWRSEFLNVLWKYVRSGQVSMALAISHLALADRMMADRSYDVPFNRVLEVAVDSGQTTYDCQFVTLATILQVPLATFDQRLLSAFPEISSLPDDLRT